MAQREIEQRAEQRAALQETKRISQRQAKPASPVAHTPIELLADGKTLEDLFSEAAKWKPHPLERPSNKSGHLVEFDVVKGAVRDQSPERRSWGLRLGRGGG